MEDIGLVQQGWKWLQSQKHLCSVAPTLICGFRDRIWNAIDTHWPMICNGFKNFLNFVGLLFLYWKDSFFRGFRSLIGLQSAALLIIMWSCFLSLTSISCLVYVLISIVSFLFLFYFIVLLSFAFLNLVVVVLTVEQKSIV